MQAHDKPRDRVGWDQRGGYGLLWQHLCNPTITTKEKTKQEKICERQNEKKNKNRKSNNGLRPLQEGDASSCSPSRRLSYVGKIETKKNLYPGHSMDFGSHSFLLGNQCLSLITTGLKASSGDFMSPMPGRNQFPWKCSGQ